MTEFHDCATSMCFPGPDRSVYRLNGFVSPCADGWRGGIDPVSASSALSLSFGKDGLAMGKVKRSGDFGFPMHPELAEAVDMLADAIEGGADEMWSYYTEVDQTSRLAPDEQTEDAIRDYFLNGGFCEDLGGR